MLPPCDRRKLQKMIRKEDGAVTVDFVMWMPVLFAIILLAADASMAFMRQSQMWQVSRETARIVSRHGMDELTAEAYAKAEATIGNVEPLVDVIVGTTDVTVSISMPIDVMTPFNTLSFAVNENITTSVTHVLEPL